MSTTPPPPVAEIQFEVHHYEYQGEHYYIAHAGNILALEAWANAHFDFDSDHIGTRKPGRRIEFRQTNENNVVDDNNIKLMAFGEQEFSIINHNDTQVVSGIREESGQPFILTGADDDIMWSFTCDSDVTAPDASSSTPTFSGALRL